MHVVLLSSVRGGLSSASSAVRVFPPGMPDGSGWAGLPSREVSPRLLCFSGVCYCLAAMVPAGPHWPNPNQIAQPRSDWVHGAAVADRLGQPGTGIRAVTKAVWDIELEELAKSIGLES